MTIPTSTDVAIHTSSAIPQTADAVAILIAENTKSIGHTESILGEPERQAAARLLAAGVCRGKAKELVADVVDLLSRRLRHLFIAGLGPPERLTAETLREAAGAIARTARKRRLRNITILTPPASATDVKGGPDEPTSASAIASGFLLASFRYEEYKGTGSKKKADDESPGPMQLTIACTPRNVSAVRDGIAGARAIADGQNFARTIASRPGNDINPPALASVAQQMAREVGLDCRILNEKEMTRLGMGGILAVGAGSTSTPPRIIVLQHRPARTKTPRGKAKAKAAPGAAPLLVIGKAITFDTGGISIKSADKMGRMIFDKCGGMAVLGLMYAAAKLDLPIPIVGILSSAENHISASAYRPGDILRMYNGVTVEVTNTDAEGRLVLGDALAWGIETFKPRACVDLATLTGGVVVALGKTMAAIMSNSDELTAQLQSAAERVGEKLWRLPLGDEQREQIKSEPADIVNSAGRDAHPLQGGAFLSYFVPQDRSVPWAHLDIAGVADTEKELPYYAKGATGWGVRTLVEWAEAMADKR